MAIELMFQTSFKRMTLPLCCGTLLAAMLTPAVMAQKVDSGEKSHANSGPATLAWSQLSTAQHQALQPLAASWPSLSEDQKKKWIALSHNYAKLSPTDQQKLHQRMADWAALTPKQRTLARLNFSQTQQVTPEDRAERWEIYQSLTPDQKKALAESAPKLPLAPTVLKPGNQNK